MADRWRDAEERYFDSESPRQTENLSQTISDADYDDVQIRSNSITDF